MRAIVYSAPGDVDVLRLIDRAVPTVGRGEVRVRIVVSGVNPTDCRSRRSPSRVPGCDQVPNQDGAGIVDAVGERVTDFAVGDRVWVWEAAWQRADGTAQELVVLPQRQVVALPNAESFDVGASLGIPALTAHLALTCGKGFPSRLEPGALAGRTVLVAGGAGAVGHAAVQLAAWAGASVVATVSSAAKGSLVRAAGAHHVVDYASDDVVGRVGEIAPDGVDLIVEVDPTANVPVDLQVLAPGGTIAIYASGEAREVSLEIRPSMTGNVRYQFILTYTTSDQAKDVAVAAVAAAVADGAMGVGAEYGLPLTRYPLDETARAHAAVEARTVGKVLIDVSDLSPRNG